MSTATQSAPTTSRQRRQLETRRALLDAAYDAFSEQGYADASLADVADRAGFTKGAIYASFASKEDLFLALVEQRMTDALDAWAADHVLAQATGLQVLDALVAWLATTVRENRAWHLVNAEFALLAARRPELAERRIVTVRALCQHFGEVLDRAMPGRLEPEERDAAGRLLLAVVNGLIIHAAVDPTVDVAADLTTATRLLVPSTSADADPR